MRSNSVAETSTRPGRVRRTASQQFAEDQLLAAIEHNGGRLYIMADDWGTWRDKWFLSPSRAAEAACRLAAAGVVTLNRQPGIVVVTRAAQ